MENLLKQILEELKYQTKENLLKQILKELKYQTKLMETLFENKDQGRAEMDMSLNDLKREMKKYPGLEDSPIGGMLNQVLTVMRKGGE